MAKLKLILGCWHYDRTRALADGSVQPDGIELEYRSAPQVGAIMERTMKGEFDVSELGITYYLRSLEQPDPPFVAIPVFPNRLFRHGAIFINKESGIQEPRDLIGRKVGELHRYGHDAGIWAKGPLHEDYGVAADSMSYYVGELETPSRSADWAVPVHPPGVTISGIRAGQTLDQMLLDGEIDALFSAWLPPSMRAGSPKIGRLFEDFETVERDYFARTKVFPIMHTVVIKRSVYRENPWVARAVMDAFEKAKQAAQNTYRAGSIFFSPALMIPWAAALQERNRRLMGDDFWPYGIERNRQALETCLRYNRQQRLLARDWKLEELFAPETLS
ncbi:MAG TPA: hypothetical protein VGF92_11495 [Stellaceae bacterium]